MPKRKTHEQFIYELKKINPNIDVLGQYVNSNTSVECKCSLCNYVWSPLANDLLRGHGCPKCYHKRNAIKRSMSTEEYLSKMTILKPQIEVLGTYINSKTAIKCRCKRCGHVWSPEAGRILYSSKGCPTCNHVSTSFIEQVILLSFDVSLPEYEVCSRNRSAIGCELDIYIEELNVAIEYGAYYWHRKKLKKDEEKYIKCKEKGIRLIRIYDKCDERISGEDIITFKEDLLSNKEKIKILISRLFSLTCTPLEFSGKEWESIFSKAYSLSRKMTTEEFKEKLNDFNPDVTVLGEYKNNHSPIKVRCNKCGRIWNPTPHGLFAGYGCRQCYISGTRITQNEFINKVKEVNPTIKILGEYTISSEPIKCQCQVCGRIWYPLAKNVLKYGCQECNLKKRSSRYRKTNAEFLKIVAESNPTVEIIGEYKGNHAPVECRCKICGRVWSPIAYNLEKGHACRNCIAKRRNIIDTGIHSEDVIRKGNRAYTHEEFVQIMSEIDDSVEIIGIYKGMNIKIECRCKVCGNSWTAYPYNLKMGSGCRKCADRRHSTYMKNRCGSIEARNKD